MQEETGQYNLFNKISSVQQEKLTHKYMVEQSYMLSQTKKILKVLPEGLELFYMNQEKSDFISFSNINSISSNDNEKEITIISHGNQHNTFYCNERRRLLTEICQYFDPNFLHIKPQESQVNGERIYHQIDFYYEDDSLLNGIFQVENVSILIKYLHQEDDEKQFFGVTDVDKSFKRSPTRKIDLESGLARDFHIYFIDIDRILNYDNTMYIIKNNTEVSKFIFQNSEKLTKTLEIVLKNSKAYLNLKLETIDMKKEEEKKQIHLLNKKENDQMDEKAFFEKLYSTNYIDGDVIYKTEGLSKLWNGTPMRVNIEITSESIYLSEIFKMEQKIRMKGDLKELKYIIINDAFDQKMQGDLVLCFIKKAGSIVKMKIKLSQKDELLTAIFCLRSLKTQNIDLLIFLHEPDFSQKILGNNPFEMESDYEVQMFKKICENLQQSRKNNKVHLDDEQKILFSEIILNTSFFNATKIDNKYIRDFADEIKKDVSLFLKLEEEIEVDDDGFDMLSSNDSYNESEYESDEEDVDNNIEENDQFENNQSNDEDSYQSNQTDEQSKNIAQNLNLSNEIQKTGEINLVSDRLSKLLCLLKIVINGRQIFREILIDYQDLIHKIIKLLGSQNVFISYQAGQIIYSLIHFYDNSENRAESNNKKELIKGRLALMKHIKKRLYLNDKLYQKKGKIKSLYVWNLYELLSALMCDRRETTLYDDYWAVIKEIFDRKDLMLLHIIDRLSMTDNFALTLGFTKIINWLFWFLQRGDNSKFKEMQAYFLVYTVQFIYNIYLILSSTLESQRKQSISLISKILSKNKYAVNILLRMFKKSLFGKVETQLELFKTYNWEETEWTQFFTQILFMNYNTPSEQWNSETLKELKDQLKQQVDYFILEKIKHQQTLSNQRQITHPTHEIFDGKIISRVKNLKWNYEELKIQYSNESRDIRVWKFYLSKLLNEGDEKTGNKPYLTVQNIKPQQVIEFWEELKLQFMPSQIIEEKQQILKIMIVLYQQQYETLRELRTLPYWLRLLRYQEFKKNVRDIDFKQFQNCQFLLLQFILSAITIQKEEIQNKNLQIFRENDGLNKILQCLNQLFSDFHVSEGFKVKKLELDLFEIEKLTIQQSQSQNENITQMIKKNYTDYIQDPQFFNKNSENINISILCLKIMDVILSKDLNKHQDNLSKNKQILLQEENVSKISSLLLIENIDLTKEIFNFIEKYYDTHFSLYQFRHSGFIECLILYLDSDLAKQAFGLLLKMQEVTLDYNDDLDLNKELDSNDIKFIDDENINDNEDNFQQAKTHTIRKNSLFLRYFPLPLVKKAHQTQSKFIEIYQTDSYEKATLIWKYEMKDKLKETIQLNFAPLIKQLKKYALEDQNLDNNQPLQFPKYKGPFKEIMIYPFIENEVRSGQYYLRVWTQQKRTKHPITGKFTQDTNQEEDLFKIPENEEEFFMEQLKQNLENFIKEEQFNEQKKLIIYLRSCLLALQTFKNKRLTCLLEIQKILNYITNNKNEIEYNDTIKEILYIGIKTIYTAISKSIHSLPNNLDTKEDEEYFSREFRKKNYNQTFTYQEIKSHYEDITDNKNEVLNFNGILLLNDVMSLILVNAMQQGQSHHSSTIVSSRLQTQQQLNMNPIDKIDESYDFPMNIEERNKIQAKNYFNSIKIDKLEAKTLLQCIEALNDLIKADIQKYLEYDLSFRTSLFKQFVIILEISYSVYKGYSNNKKSNYEKNKNLPLLVAKQGGTLNSQNKLNGSFQNEEFQNNLHASQKQSQQQIMISQLNQSTTVQNTGQKAFLFGQSAFGGGIGVESLETNKNQMSQQTDLRQFYQNNQLQTPANNQQINFQSLSSKMNPQQKIILESSFQKSRSTHKKRGNYKLYIDFYGESQQKNEKNQVLKLIFNLAKSIFQLGRDLSIKPIIHPEIIQSGFAWKCLQHIFFSLLNEFKQDEAMEQILQHSVYTLQHLTSFASIFTPSNKNQQTFADLSQGLFSGVNLKRLSNEKERNIIFEYYQAIQKLLERKILDNLECINFDFDPYSQEIRFINPKIQEQNYKKFLKIFSIAEEKTPELIWNEQSIQELEGILQDQLNNIDISFFDIIKEFDYTINKNELRIENIFVKHFNSDIYFRPSNVSRFMTALLQELGYRLEDKFLSDLDQMEFNNVLEIIKALRNLVEYQNILSTTGFQFEENIILSKRNQKNSYRLNELTNQLLNKSGERSNQYQQPQSQSPRSSKNNATEYKYNAISLFCQILQVKDNDVSSEGDIRLKIISSIIFDILKFISKTDKLAGHLLNNLEFIKLVTRSLFVGEREIFDIEEIKKMVQILENLLIIEQIETDKFLIQHGISMFFIHIILEKSAPREIRYEILKLLKLKIEELSQIIGAFMPIQFFDMTELLLKFDMASKDDLVEKFIQQIDSNQYENIFLMWSSEINDQQHYKIKQECQRIIKNLRNCEDFDNFDVKITTEPFNNPLYINEIILQDIIVRIFNKDPVLYIGTTLESFLESLCLQLDKQIFSLGQINQIFDKNQIEYDGTNDDQIIVQVHSNVFTAKQIKKKQRYLSHQSLYVLTSIILTLEQIIYNEFNPNKKRYSVAYQNDPSQSNRFSSILLQYDDGGKKITRDQQSQRELYKTQPFMRQSQQFHQQQMMESVTEEAKNIPSYFYESFQNWLKDQMFTKKNIPLELKLSFLQLIYLTLDIPLAFFKLKDELLEFINDQITKIHNYEIEKSIEEMFILLIAQKVMKIGGIAVIDQFYNENLDRIINIHQKKKLSKLVEELLTIMAKHDQCKEHFLQLSKQADQFKDKETKILWKDILNPRRDQQSELHQSEPGQLRVWRNKPQTVNEARRSYALTEFLEDKLEESNSNKVKMPLISKKSIEEIKRDEAIGEGELSISTLVEDFEILEKKEKDWERNKEINLQLFT